MTTEKLAFQIETGDMIKGYENQGEVETIQTINGKTKQGRYTLVYVFGFESGKSLYRSENTELEVV